MATFSDPTPGHVDALRRDVGYAAVDFVNEARQRGIPLIVTSSIRSVAEQQRLVAAGRSTTMRSFHLTGQAIDVDLWRTDRNAVPDTVWKTLAMIARGYGFEWGGDWKTFVDKGHFQRP